MGFQLSPGVVTKEIDLSTIVAGVATTGGVLAGPSVWGPVQEKTLVDSEITLVNTFGKPDTDTADVFFTGASFLQYGNNLTFVRCISSAARNAAVKGDGVLSIAITNAGAGYTRNPTLSFSGGGGTGAAATATASSNHVASVAITNAGSGYTSAPTITVTPAAAVKAHVNILAGNAGITYTADTAGTAGNGITVRYVVSGNNTALSVSVTSLAITVNVATDGGGAPTSTATLVKAAVDASGPAAALVDTALLGDGSNTVSAVSATNLAGGLAADTPGTTAVLTASTGIVIKNRTDYETNYAAGQGVAGEFAARYPGELGNSLEVHIVDNPTDFLTWTYAPEFSVAPGTSDYADRFGGSDDELHIVVVDATGRITGTAGEVVEKYAFLSKAADALDAQGNSIYYPNWIFRNSNWIYWMDHPAAGTNWGTNAANTTFTQLSGEYDNILVGGIDSNNTLTDGDIINGYDEFLAEDFDFALLMTASHDETVVEHCISNIAEERLDNVVFISPPKVAVVANTGHEVTDIVNYRNTLPDSSYAFLDSNWIRKYDKYNDIYRWVPANGDVAGLCVRTDDTRDPWFSPAGLNRGQIKGVTALAWNPRLAFRDTLYQAGVNPIVQFPGQGTVLFGDKTLQAKPSAFDRINVRRLFIVLEKAISAAAKFVLFEFNDDITRSQFRALIDPFLRDIQGRRGLFAYKIVCDASNNTPDVIDSNSFRGDIYLQPNKSINFITLNFIATRTGVNFDEIVGKF
jgi:Phage tail sheath protein subtilisin-like domain/Phage tail sheath C-terminal domain